MEEVLEGMWGLFLVLSDLQEPWLGDVEMHYSDAREKCWELAGGASKGKKQCLCVGHEPAAPLDPPPGAQLFLPLTVLGRTLSLGSRIKIAFGGICQTGELLVL